MTMDHITIKDPSGVVRRYTASQEALLLMAEQAEQWGHEYVLVLDDTPGCDCDMFGFHHHGRVHR